MSTKHTPAPWQIKSEHEPEYIIGDIDGPDDGTMYYKPVAEVCETADFEANARLIAAAPELLHELEKAHQIITVLLNLVPSERKFEMAEALAKLHDGEGAVRYHERAAVLAKATGEQQ